MACGDINVLIINHEIIELFEGNLIIIIIDPHKHDVVNYNYLCKLLKYAPCPAVYQTSWIIYPSVKAKEFDKSVKIVHFSALIELENYVMI